MIAAPQSRILDPAIQVVIPTRAFLLSTVPGLLKSPVAEMRRLSNLAPVVELPYAKLFKPFSYFMHTRKPPDRVLMINDMGLIKAIHEEPNFEKGGVALDPVSSLVGDETVFTANGDIWKDRRRIGGSFLSPKNVVSLVPQFENLTDDLVRKWRQQSQYIDVNRDMHDLMLKILFKSLFSTDITDAECQTMQSSIDNKFKEMFLMSVDYTGLLQGAMNFFNRGVKKQSGTSEQPVSKINRILQRAIQARLDLMKDHPESVPADLLTAIINRFLHEPSPSKRDHLSPTQEAFQSIRNEMLIYVLAGHETTANTLTTTLHDMIKNEDVHAKVVQEIRSLKTDSITNYRDLAKWKATLQLIFETLRMSPPVYVSGRVVKKSFAYKTPRGDVILPAGATVVFSPYSLGRDSNYWERPDEFLLERHTIDPHARSLHLNPLYSPFGFGPHRCSGETFAMIEMVTVLRCIFGALDIELHPDSNPVQKAAVTLGMRDFYINVKPAVGIIFLR